MFVFCINCKTIKNKTRKYLARFQLSECFLVTFSMAADNSITLITTPFMHDATPKEHEKFTDVNTVNPCHICIARILQQGACTEFSFPLSAIFVVSLFKCTPFLPLDI